MTTYQKNVLTYLSERGPQFIEWIATQTGDSQIIGDMYPVAVRFIDVKLRGEMALYSKESVRYNDLIDMLIEIRRHVADDFRQKLGKIASDFFLGKGLN